MQKFKPIFSVVSAWWSTCDSLDWWVSIETSTFIKLVSVLVFSVSSKNSTFIKILQNQNFSLPNSVLCANTRHFRRTKSSTNTTVQSEYDIMFLFKMMQITFSIKLTRTLQKYLGCVLADKQHAWHVLWTSIKYTFDMKT